MVSTPKHPNGAERVDHSAAVPTLPMLIGTALGTGFSPFAPGTMGALLALVVWLGLSFLMSVHALFWLTLVLIVLFTLLGVWAANRLEPFWGEDPRRVVVDEVVGVWIPLLVADSSSWWQVLAAFVLFRFFDILKPLGVRRMEDFRGGVGVMADDILAGIYSLLILLVARWLTGL